jgi:hypothetical protein
VANPPDSCQHLVEKTGLADSGLALHQDNLADAVGGLPERPQDFLELDRASNQLPGLAPSTGERRLSEWLRRRRVKRLRAPGRVRLASCS